MEQLRERAIFLYKHDFVRYLFVGGSTFIMDFLLLFVLHGTWHVNLAVATTVAYWVSIAYNFILNRWWTFNQRERQNLSQHALLYACIIGFNYLFTVTFVSLASHHIYYGLAKIMAVAIQMSWTYYIYKHYIFTTKVQE